MNKCPPAPQNEYFFERYPWNNQGILFASALILSCFDFLARPIIFFPVLFIIPLTLMAWNCGLRTALWLGTVLCVIRVTIQYGWGIPYPLHIAIINGCLRLGVLLTITFLVGKLSQQTRALRARVRTLEGILPTCSFCKDIRDEHGQWHQIEEYVTNRTEAHFSHGVCPDCVTKHYGDILLPASEKVMA